MSRTPMTGGAAYPLAFKDEFGHVDTERGMTVATWLAAQIFRDHLQSDKFVPDQHGDVSTVEQMAKDAFDKAETFVTTGSSLGHSL